MLNTMIKQTSVEWLIEQMLMKGYFDKNVTFTNIDHLQHEAKEMHKQEIVDAVTYGNNFYRNCESAVVTGEKYYDENFK